MDKFPAIFVPIIKINNNTFFYSFSAMLLSGGDAAWAAGDAEKIRLSREEDLYKQEMIRLEKDLT